MTLPDHPIACRGLTKRYGDVTGAQDVDLVVPAGSVTGFLGPNGAGKTTLIRMLVGLLHPTAGEALLWGRPAGEAAARERLGFMPADPAFYLTLTGRENLDLLAGLHNHDDAPDRAWALELLELSDAELDRPVREYSSGMTQKLALVQAVQHRPDLVILDEPANRLDPLAHRHFEDMVRHISGEGRTILLSSHTLPEVEDVCDRVAMIRHGRLLDVRSVTELADVALRRVTATYDGPPPQPPRGLLDPVRNEHVLTGRVARGELAVMRELLATPHLVDLTVEPGTLEEAFLRIYEDDA